MNLRAIRDDGSARVKVAAVAEVELTRDRGVLTITLNRPEVLNALNGAMHEGIHNALSQAAGDPAIRAVLITGAGRGFCVGQDLQEFAAGAGDVADNLRRNYHRNVRAIRALEKPVIAAVNGPAAGAGLSLALACDVRVASDAASFVPAFISIGLVPDSGGTWLARRLLGTARAFEWLTTGRRLGPEEARAWGVVSEVVPAAELPERAHEVAQLFAAMPTRAVWQTKRLLDAAETSTFEQQLELEAQTQAELTKTRDFREGVAAFLEKREAHFTGADVDWSHPVRLFVNDDLRRWRLTVGLRWLLALPHFLVLALWTYAALPVAVVDWFITLFRGRSPASVHRWLASFVRYQAHVYAYAYLVADPFPSFRGDRGYPIDVDIAPAARQAWWKTLLRVVLVIPAYVFATALGYVLAIVAVLGFFFALALGRYPKGFRDLGAYALRFQAQTFAYLLLLTDRYPSLAATGVAQPTPASSSAAAGRT
jgi:2-(1,2-epoxy-1,2-dihydrophenyl)acetyl-CoA isomerase